MNWYLKYEKTLYVLDDKQVSTIRQQLEKGGRITIHGQMLMAGKCELVNELPSNRDEYEVKHNKTQNPQLPSWQQEYHISDEDRARRAKYIAEIRNELVQKLGWSAR
jgi:muramoyltetrapeptide carboxypeptidase LdcA involved in peptidoglycan recycling